MLARGLIVKDIHKEMFYVWSVKCLLHKSVHNWVKKRGKHFADNEEVETEAQKCWDSGHKTSLLLVSMLW
jgi:hypothetical protein